MYSFEVQFNDGSKESYSYDSLAIAMRKQAEFVKKAKKNGRIAVVTGVTVKGDE